MFDKFWRVFRVQIPWSISLCPHSPCFMPLIPHLPSVLSCSIGLLCSICLSEMESGSWRKPWYCTCTSSWDLISMSIYINTDIQIGLEQMLPRAWSCKIYRWTGHARSRLSFSLQFVKHLTQIDMFKLRPCWTSGSDPPHSRSSYVSLSLCSFFKTNNC